MAFKLSTILGAIGLALGGFVMYTILFMFVYYVTKLVG
mgnify:CR=1 FL=1